MRSILKMAVVAFLALTAIVFSATSEQADAYYINENDGYAFNAPKEFVVDESFLPDTVRFISSDTTVQIYAEPCESKLKKAEYINYTNKAITEDTVNYTNVKQITDNGKTILLWSRKKLSKVSNDKNHYIKIDIPHYDYVYTILVKSSKEQWDYDKYADMLSFTSIAKKRGALRVKTPAKGGFNEETQAFYDNSFVNSNGVKWGIYQPDFRDMPKIYYIEEHIGHKFDIVLHYNDILETYNPYQVRDVLDKAYAEGRTVELTLQPNRDSSGENTLFALLDGKYDEFLHAYAKDVAEFSHPVLFRLCNEMNGDWCEYSGYRMSLDTELYRELYRYIYSIFEEHNADNVIWVWNPNGKSFPNVKWNSERMYYPGNKYVDVLGLTLYNTGNFYEGEKWTEFEELYAPLYANASKEYNMPFMITEFASARCGGNKEEWTRNMLESISNYPKIKAAVWWNHADFDAQGNVSRAYYINDTDEMVSIFRDYFEKG